MPGLLFAAGAVATVAAMEAGEAIERRVDARREAFLASLSRDDSAAEITDADIQGMRQEYREEVRKHRDAARARVAAKAESTAADGAPRPTAEEAAQ